MDRTNFYAIVDVGYGDEFDFMNNTLSKFKLKYSVQYYRIELEDWMRPDLISYKIFDTVAYWEFIMLINGVTDMFNELTVGKLLAIPNILDIYEFYKKYSFR